MQNINYNSHIPVMADSDSIVTCPLCCFQMTINSKKLRESQEEIERLLKEKQAFNSNVVTEIYAQFKESAIQVSILICAFRPKQD